MNNKRFGSVLGKLLYKNRVAETWALKRAFFNSQRISLAQAKQEETHRDSRKIWAVSKLTRPHESQRELPRVLESFKPNDSQPCLAWASNIDTFEKDLPVHATSMSWLVVILYWSLEKTLSHNHLLTKNNCQQRNMKIEGCKLCIKNWFYRLLKSCHAVSFSKNKVSLQRVVTAAWNSNMKIIVTMAYLSILPLGHTQTLC